MAAGVLIGLSIGSMSGAYYAVSSMRDHAHEKSSSPVTFIGDNGSNVTIEYYTFRHSIEYYRQSARGLVVTFGFISLLCAFSSFGILGENFGLSQLG